MPDDFMGALQSQFNVNVRVKNEGLPPNGPSKSKSKSADDD